MNRKASRVKWIVVIALVVLLALIGGCVAWWSQTEGGQRTIKTWQSNNVGGLERTVEVYDNAGHLIKTYEGKIDIQENDYDNKVLFDLNGKRTVIYNATVIVQEK